MVKTKAQIIFHYLSGHFYFPDRNRVKEFIIQLIKKEGFKTDTINYIFCTDDYLLNINKQYLNHDTYTDIITFPNSGKGEPISSDIFISIDRIKENALQFNTSFINELHRVMFHGALHLCGYKDKTKEQSSLMRKMEQHYLDKYFK